MFEEQSISVSLNVFSCLCQLWDLIQGKMITEFKSHSAAVNIVQFHPNEYLLASGSSDRYDAASPRCSLCSVSSCSSCFCVLRCNMFDVTCLLLQCEFVSVVCRTVKLWDLEKFTMVGSMEGNTTPVR